MRAVVLVGGEGTRLRPLTFGTPKPMLPVAEVPIIERVLAHLAGHGIDEAVLSMGYQPEAFLDAYPEDVCAGVRLTYAVEPERRDTAGGIKFAAAEAGIDETFLVVNGDVLSDWDLSALIDLHRRSGAEGTIALTPVEDPSGFGVVPTDDDGRVQSFIEKPAPGTAPTNLINAGYYVLEPAALDRIAPGVPVNIERETFPAMVEAGALYALGSDAYWTDTGTPALLLGAALDFVNGRRSGPPLTGAKQEGDRVWTCGTTIVDGRVTGPALLGDASYVGVDAHVEDAIVGTGARVEAGAAVRRSVLMPGAVVREGAVVEDSIVGESAVVGLRARLSALSVVQGRAKVPDDTTEEGARVAR